jgi:Flp pilus assembly protein TadD
MAFSGLSSTISCEILQSDRVRVRWLVLQVLLVTALLASAGAQEQLGKARALIEQGRYQDGRAILETLSRTKPDKAEVQYLLGLASFRLGEFPKAIAYLRRVAELTPQDVRTFVLLARALAASGQRIETERVLKKAIDVAPDNAEAWSLLGRLYEDDNRFVDALPALERALTLNPGDVLALSAMAHTQAGLGQNDHAVAIYRKAVACNEQLPRPLPGPPAAFAILLLRLDRVDEAAVQARRALAIDPMNENAREAQKAINLRSRSSPTRVLLPKEVPTVPVFEDIAETTRLNFRLQNSPTPEKHQIETMPGGVAVLDYDRDGFMDIYFVNGARSPSLEKSDDGFWNRLYHNNGDGSFTDVTARAAVQGSGYMMGASAGDFDNDGYPDLFVVGVRQNILYKNNRDGTFSDVTKAAGLDKPDPGFGTMWGIHAAWLDYNSDGWLDLLVVNYCVWDPAREPFCGDERPGGRSYCHPRMYAPLPNRLFHNNGDGTFTDVSAKSGIGAFLGKGMGAATADFDGDGRVDIFIANDTEPNFLFRNKGDGTFEEVAEQMSVAFNQFGGSVSSMGADFRDIDNDGRPDLFITDLSNEGWLLFHNALKWFDDISDQARVTVASLPFGGWSDAIVDLNNDSWKDLFSANGHVMDNISLAQSREYRQRNSILLNNGDGTFRDASDEAGPAFARKAAHRGAAVADFDNDGRMDLVVTALGDRPELLHNITPTANHWLILRLVGSSSNRDALGAVVRLETSDGKTMWNHVSTSVGFASSSDPRVHFGLGKSDKISSVHIAWPGGKAQTIHDAPVDRLITITEAR